jgi:hypothetical protein
VSIGKVTGTVGLDCLILKKEAMLSVEETVILQQSTCRNIPEYLDLILLLEHTEGWSVDTKQRAQHFVCHLMLRNVSALTVGHLQGAFFSMFSLCLSLACAACVATYMKHKLHIHTEDGK